MPQTVLIVDDMTAMHDLIKVHLDEEGWALHSLFDGASALVAAASMNPDLILLDVDMPGMNGFDVCRALKANVQTSHIPVIFLTAATSPDEKVCGLELRAVDYITKPFDPGELRVRVRSALRTKRLLDLLPKSPTDAASAATAQAGGEGRQVNARLSMKQMLHARAANPWNRKPPQSGSTPVAANPPD